MKESDYIDIFIPSYHRPNNLKTIKYFLECGWPAKKLHIGLWGLSQGGDVYSNDYDTKLYRSKVMNATFYLMPYVYRGERGVQDDDTSLFTGVMNEGLFTGSLAYGLILQQTASATAKGGLTDLYNECIREPAFRC